MNNSIEISLNDFYNNYRHKFNEITVGEGHNNPGSNRDMEKGQSKSRQNFRKPSSFNIQPNRSVHFKNFGKSTILLSRTSFFHTGASVAVFKPTQEYRGLIAKIDFLKRFKMTKDFIIKKTMLDPKIIYEDEDDDMNSEIYADAFIGAYLNRLRSLTPTTTIPITPCFMQVLDWFKTKENFVSPIKIRKKVYKTAQVQYVLMEKANFTFEKYLEGDLSIGTPTYRNINTFILILMHALESSFHFYNYIHYDLHDGNVMVKRILEKDKIDQIWSFERSREEPDDDVEDEKTYLYIQPEDHKNILPLIIDFGRSFIQVPFANAQDHNYSFEKKAIENDNKTSFFYPEIDYEEFGIYYEPDYLNRGFDLKLYAIKLLEIFFFDFGGSFIKKMKMESNIEDTNGFKIIIMKMLQIGKINPTILSLMESKIESEILGELGNLKYAFDPEKITKNALKPMNNFMDALISSIKYIEDGNYLSAYKKMWVDGGISESKSRLELLLTYWVWSPWVGVKNLKDEKTKKQGQELEPLFYEYTSATDIINDNYFQDNFGQKPKLSSRQYVDNRKIVSMAKWIHPAQLKRKQFMNFTPLECKFCKTKTKDRSILQICSGCNKVAYCSRDCQSKDWSEHKLECN